MDGSQSVSGQNSLDTLTVFLPSRSLRENAVEAQVVHDENEWCRIPGRYVPPREGPHTPTGHDNVPILAVYVRVKLYTFLYVVSGVSLCRMARV